MPLSEIAAWAAITTIGCFYIWLFYPKRLATESQVDAQSVMSDPDILIGDFGQVTIVYDNYFKHEWIVDDPFDCLKELGLIGEKPSPKLEDTGEPE